MTPDVAAVLAKVRAIHADEPCGCLGGRCSNCPNGRFCNECDSPAPCATVRALDGDL